MRPVFSRGNVPARGRKVWTEGAVISTPINLQELGTKKFTAIIVNLLLYLLYSQKGGYCHEHDGYLNETEAVTSILRATFMLEIRFLSKLQNLIARP
jgi:hypothetical protein